MLKNVMLTVGMLLSFSVASGSENLLANAQLKLTEGRLMPDNWIGDKNGMTYQQVTEGLPEEVGSNPALALQVTSSVEQKFAGNIRQRVKLTAVTPSNLTFYAFVRSDIPGNAYLEIKLLKEGKELARIDSAKSTQEWQRLRIGFNTAGADAVDVLCRWDAKATDGNVNQFAGAKLLPADKTLALAGDSIVRDYLVEENQRGWGQMLPAYFRDNLTVLNYAVSGRSTKTFLAKHDWEKLLASHPDFVMIQFGHNDSHGPDKEESTTASGDYPQNLTKMVQEAKQAGITPILVTPPHRRIFKDDKISSELTPYAEAMIKVGQELNVSVIDLHAHSAELMQPMGDAGCAPLFCSEKDRTHFSIKGAQMLAGILASDLRKACPDLAELLRAEPKPSNQ